MQELIERLNSVKPTQFCSIETIKGWAESMLEKEKDVMIGFATHYSHNAFTLTHITEEFEETFNSKER